MSITEINHQRHLPTLENNNRILKPAPHLRTFPWICASNLFVAQIRGIVRARFVSTSSHKSMELCELDVYPHYASKSYTAKQLPWWKDEYRRFVGSLCCAFYKRKKKKSNMDKREQLGCTHLLRELLPYLEDVHTFLRMDENSYLELLDLVRPRIEKQSTVLRSPIDPHQRLMATLRYLATGASYQDLKFTTRISAQASSNIIPEFQ